MRTIAGASAGRRAVARAPLSRPVQGKSAPALPPHARGLGGTRPRRSCASPCLGDPPPLEFRSTWACSRTGEAPRHQGEGQRAYAEAEAVRGLDGLHEAPFSGDAGAHARTGGGRHGEGGARGDGAQVPRASDRQERQSGRDRRGARELAQADLERQRLEEEAAAAEAKKQREIAEAKAAAEAAAAARIAAAAREKARDDVIVAILQSTGHRRERRREHRRAREGDAPRQHSRVHARARRREQTDGTMDKIAALFYKFDDDQGGQLSVNEFAKLIKSAPELVVPHSMQAERARALRGSNRGRVRRQGVREGNHEARGEERAQRRAAIRRGGLERVV